MKKEMNMEDRKKSIEILEKDPELHGAKTALLRHSLIDEIRAKTDELDPRIGGKRHDLTSIVGGGGWPNRDEEELLRVEICLLLELLPRLDEGPF